ncbi:MAG: hypothetical protein AB1352_00425 [Patescibacteria group bacterium]
MYWRRCFIIIIIVAQLVPWYSIKASWDPNYLMSDYEFTDWSSLNLQEIQNFLSQKKSALASYVDPITRQRAAQLIFDSAVVYQINPKALLTLIQKEQSLVEDGMPTQDQFDWATGFGICDSCSKQDPSLQAYKGFAIQVDRCAWRLRYFLEHEEEFNFQTGQTYSIDGQYVTLTNDATRALYTYTPHLHGNLNFVAIWNRWFAKNYPDGSVLQDRDSKTVWLIQKGLRRKFASLSVVLSRVSYSHIIQAPLNDIMRYEEGTSIKFPEYSLVRSPRGTVYLMVDDVKRGIVNRETFRQLGFNPEEVINASWDDLTAIPDGPPITQRNAYPLGALLQDTSSGGVWYVQDGVKHALIARELLEKFPGKKLIRKRSADLEQFETGDPLKLTDGTLVGLEETDQIAIITNGSRRIFASREAFHSLGYREENILMIPEKLWNLHSEGPFIEQKLAEHNAE